eukprot:1873957-Pyramimonas_sp.AAC.1
MQWKPSCGQCNCAARHARASRRAAGAARTSRRKTRLGRLVLPDVALLVSTAPALMLDAVAELTVEVAVDAALLETVLVVTVLLDVALL